MQFTLALLTVTALAINSVTASVNGVATFNPYVNQPHVSCNGETNQVVNGVYPAAIADLSPDLWHGAPCEYGGNGPKTAESKFCNGSGGTSSLFQTELHGYGPSCPQTNCGKCYLIKCIGTQDVGAVGRCSGRSVKVKAVDSCPHLDPQNYCKNAPYAKSNIIGRSESCTASGLNALDVDERARSLLSTYKGNLKISISGTSC